MNRRKFIGALIAAPIVAKAAPLLAAEKIMPAVATATTKATSCVHVSWDGGHTWEEMEPIPGQRGAFRCTSTGPISGSMCFRHRVSAQ